MKIPPLATRTALPSGRRRAVAPARRRRPVQLAFEDPPRHGGKRKGAGRKARPRPPVRHEVRPVFRPWKPVHVTLRASRKTCPSLREELLANAVKDAIRATRPVGFRVVHYSIQDDHVHALVEADGHAELTRGMRSLGIRIALRINRALRRRSGKVWGDRYHRRDLTSPREVRSAIVYVLANYKKHFRVTHGQARIDPCSSAPWFRGWTAERAPPDEPSPVVGPETKLLAELWRKHGLVDPRERPATPRARRGR